MDPHRRRRFGPRPLGESGVIAVRMREQHGVQIVERPVERRDGPGERIEVARGARVDERELAPVLHQIEVDDAVRQPMDAGGDLHPISPAAEAEAAWMSRPSSGSPRWPR